MAEFGMCDIEISSPLQRAWSESVALDAAIRWPVATAGWHEMAVKAVFFDMDGTLVDSNEFHVNAWQEAFGTVGVNLDQQVIRSQIGKGADMLIPSLLPDVAEAEQRTIANAHSQAFQSKYLRAVRPFPGAHDLLVHVHRAGQKIVVASSSRKERLQHCIDLLGVRAIIEGVIGGDDVERSKPAPDVFAAALKKVSPVSADEVIAVGDSPYDVEAATPCGIRTIALRSGKFADVVMTAAGAIAIYDDVANLLSAYSTSPLARPIEQ